MNKKSNETRITVRFPTEVVAALRLTAQEHQRSLNGEIVWAVREYLARDHQKRQQESQ